MNVLITGGTTGIGLGLATYYLDQGHRVGITGRNLAKLPSGFSDKYENLETFQVDVCDEEKMAAAVKGFAANGLDIVIANAGISDWEKKDTPNFSHGRKIIATNVQGVLNTFDPSIEHFLHQGAGHIVVISSVAAFLGIPGSSFYCASKAAVFRLCESLSIDLKKRNIDVTTICPGFIDTPLTQKNKHKMLFLMPVEKGAAKIAKAIEKKKGLYLFPWPMAIIVTVLNKMPRYLYRKVMILPFMNYSKES